MEILALVITSERERDVPAKLTEATAAHAQDAGYAGPRSVYLAPPRTFIGIERKTS